MFKCVLNEHLHNPTTAALGIAAWSSVVWVRALRVPAALVPACPLCPLVQKQKKGTPWVVPSRVVSNVPLEWLVEISISPFRFRSVYS